MRSILDPQPRPLSTSAVVLLVGMLVFGTGIAVVRYVDAAQPAVSPRPPATWVAPEGRARPEPPRTVRLQARPGIGAAASEVERLSDTGAAPEPRVPRAPSMWRPQDAGG